MRRGLWIRISVLLLFMLSLVSVASVTTAATVISVGNTPMDFQHPLGGGGSFRYANVLTKGGITVDAKVTVTVDNAFLDDIDATVIPQYENRFQPTITTASGAGSITFTFEFVNGATGDPVFLRDFYLTVFALDGDDSGTAREFAEISDYATYAVAEMTELTIEQVGNGRTRFTGIGREEDDLSFKDVDSFYAHYTDPISTLDVVLGHTGEMSDRQFSLLFGLPGGVFSAGGDGEEGKRVVSNPAPTLTVQIADGGDWRLTPEDDLRQVTIFGTTTAESGQRVTIEVSDKNGQVIEHSAVVMSTRDYFVNLDLSSMADGLITVVATTVNRQGHSSAPATTRTTKDTFLALEIVITSADEAGERTPTISGTTNAADGSTVTVELNDQTYTTTASGGSWSVKVTDPLFDGTYLVNATVLDRYGNTETVSQNLTVYVFMNVAPSFTKGANQEVLEDADRQVKEGWATDIQAGPPSESGQTLTFILTTDESDLFAELPAIDTDGTLTYKPAANAFGVALVEVTLKDNGGTANGGVDTSPPQDFVIKVTAVNDPPSFSGGPDVVVSRNGGDQLIHGWATEITAGPNEDDDQSVTFEVDTDPDELFTVLPAIDPATGNLTFTLAANAYGEATVMVTPVDDGGTEDGGIDRGTPYTFTIRVLWVNVAPTLAHIPDQLGDELTQLSFTAVGSDIDLGLEEIDEELTYRLIDEPAGAVIDPVTGIFTWTPTEEQDGVHSFTVRVTDHAGAYAEREITVTVHEVNLPPVLAPIRSKSTYHSAALTFAISATDSDLVAGVPNTLTYSASNLPTGASFDPATRTFTWTPARNQVGTHSVTFAVSDGIETVEEIVAIRVRSLGSLGEPAPPPPTGSKSIFGRLLIVGNPEADPQATNLVLTTGATIIGEVRSSAGTPLPLQVRVNPDGTFEVSDVTPGDYQILFTVALPTGERLAGIMLQVTINSDGEMAAVTGLIDPYGWVTDAKTGEPIKDALMKLYWADTPLNRSKGRAPHSLVTLPVLPDFAPNQNRVPQSTTADGAYAWMVWADGDYYIVAERSGYQPHDSREEGQTVGARPGESSYIKDGIIHVGETIVTYSLMMQPIGTPATPDAPDGPGAGTGTDDETGDPGPLPLLPKPERQASGEHVRYIFGNPDKSFGPERPVTRAEVATVIARILGLSVTAPQQAPYPDVAPADWYAGSIAAIAQVGIMQGYPDGSFHPNAPITRAEIVTVMTRLRGLYPVAGAPFTDLTAHWAEGYVVAAMQGELVTGYPDGSFRPDAYMTRAEFVTAINRLLNRGPLVGRPEPTWLDVPESHWAYGHVEEASTDHAYEAAAGPSERWLEDR